MGDCPSLCVRERMQLTLYFNVNVTNRAGIATQNTFSIRLMAYFEKFSTVSIV